MIEGFKIGLEWIFGQNPRRESQENREKMREVRENEACLSFIKPRKRRSSYLDQA